MLFPSVGVISASYKASSTAAGTGRYICDRIIFLSPKTSKWLYHRTVFTRYTPVKCERASFAVYLRSPFHVDSQSTHHASLSMPQQKSSPNQSLQPQFTPPFPTCPLLHQKLRLYHLQPENWRPHPRYFSRLHRQTRNRQCQRIDRMGHQCRWRRQTRGLRGALRPPRPPEREGRHGTTQTGCYRHLCGSPSGDGSD